MSAREYADVAPSVYFLARATIRALGSIGAVEAIDDLVLRLRDEDIDVCIDAAEALGKLNALQVVPQLLE